MKIKVISLLPQTQLSFFLLLLIPFFTFDIKAQQGYSGNSVLDCDHQSWEPPSPSYLYSCNGDSQSCQAFLIFKSQPNYNSINNISRLFTSDPSQLIQINNSSYSSIFPANKEVIIPVICSCSGLYYQANTSYVIGDNDTYSNLADDPYQGLSSCNALVGENPNKSENLSSGIDLLVPLRCACPTSNQIRNGVRYLLTYSLNENDSLSMLSERFNVSENETAAANRLTQQDPVIFPLTTLLIPLLREPLSSQTITYHPIVYTPPPPPPPLPFIRKVQHLNRRLCLGVSLGVVSVLVLLFGASIVYWIQRKRMKRDKGKKRHILPKEIFNAVARINRVLKVFEVEELKAATKDFNAEHRIEGSVYKGMVDTKVFAIKKMNKDVTNEANILHKLNHVNLISLYGIGTGEEHYYLVYEYMENGSLKDWLQDSGSSGLWKWTQRVQIALDIANGLDYLHNFTDPPYVHKDIKTSNVLLDGKFRAKITNFSLATSSDWSGGSILTKNVEGTIGSMAPEYLESGMITPKIDVYAFGVVLSELITGKNVVLSEHNGRELLSDAIVSIVQGRNAEAKLLTFMELAIRSTSPIGLVMEVAKLCVACLTKNHERRPSMREVVSVLSRIQMDSHMWELAYQ